MTKEAPAWFAPEHSQEVIHRFQSEGNSLGHTHRKVKKIVGDRLILRRMGQMETSPLVVGSNAVPANPEMTTFNIDTEAHQIVSMVFEDDLEQMTPDERDDLAKETAWAFGRKKDAITYGAIDREKGNFGTVVGDYSTGFDPAMALKACQLLQSRDVPWDNQIYCPLPSLYWAHLLTYDVFNSADYNGPDLPLVSKGNMRSWAGVHWFLASDSIFPLTGTNRRFYMYHWSALASGEIYDIRCDVAWENLKTGWSINDRMRIGAQVIDKDGFVEIHVNEAAQIELH